jgi:hypothetical protein
MSNGQRAEEGLAFRANPPILPKIINTNAINIKHDKK